MREAIEAGCAEADASFEASVVAGLEALLEFIAERPAAARMCMLEAISATPSSARLYDAGMRDCVQLLRAHAPADAGLPDTIEESLIGGVAWILQLKIRKGEAEDAPELLAELSQFVLSPYLGVGKLVDTGRRK
jgi:hypothetical protein